MGFLDKMFGKKPAAAAHSADKAEGPGNRRSQPITGPPEFVRAAALQRDYWTHNADEQSKLEAIGVDQLDWRDLLRLHHLICLERALSSENRAAATEKCRHTIRRLMEPDSPYRPRPAMIWQGTSAQTGGEREPDLQGEFANASHSHLGCLEVYRVDAANQAVAIDFVGFDELSGVMFAPPNLIRAAKVFHDDGKGEIVLVPMLYGLTWALGNEFDRDGRMTRFVAHLDGPEFGALNASGMGVGQQDFTVRIASGGNSLFGVGSIAEVSFPLDMRDPRFDEKARARGLDPDEIHKRMEGKPNP